MDGIIIINKPQDMTSHDVISFMRRKTGVKRIGHSGTLDPMATGVLPVFIGKATRVIQFASEEGSKTAKLYRCTMKLGCTSDTQDIWGEVKTSEDYVVPSSEEIKSAINSFVGEITQIPPSYSAIKVDGRKLYEYARKGVAVPIEKIKVRKAFINSIVINSIVDNMEINFDVESSKGLYVRTLCSDIGQLLGCGAVMSGLQRLRSDGFSIDKSYSIDDLRMDTTVLPDLLALDFPLAYMPKVILSDEEKVKYMNGISIIKSEEINYISNDIENSEYIRVYSGDEFIGIAKNLSDKIKPYKVFS